MQGYGLGMSTMICNYPTLDGAPCQNPVLLDSEHCAAGHPLDHARETGQSHGPLVELVDWDSTIEEEDVLSDGSLVAPEKAIAPDESKLAKRPARRTLFSKRAKMANRELTNSQLWEEQRRIWSNDMGGLIEEKRYGGLIKADLHGSKLTKVTLDLANLAKANLSGAVITKSSLRETRLKGANLSGSHLQDVDAKGAKLPGADLSRSTVVLTSFADASCTRASFRGAALTDVNFTTANLSFADFRGADLGNVDFSGASLWGAKFDPGAEPAGWVMANAKDHGGDLWVNVPGERDQQRIRTAGLVRVKD